MDEKLMKAADLSPYGKTLREFKPKTEKYLTTHHERDTETGLDYRGARYYDGDVPRFGSLDPKATTYPSLSPYNYVGGNPIAYVDPDGKEFVTYYKVKNPETGKRERFKATFDGQTATVQRVIKGKPTGNISTYESGTSEMMDGVIESYNYIVGNGADIDGAFQEVASSNVEVLVKFNKMDGAHRGGEILFDFNYGLEVFDLSGKKDKSLGVQSAALGFWSEVYHAFLHLDGNYKLNDTEHQAEEDKVHTEKEPQVIDKLKEKDSSNNEAKRKAYKAGDAWPVKTKDITSTEKK